jgi:hypothetical protein
MDTKEEYPACFDWPESHTEAVEYIQKAKKHILALVVLIIGSWILASLAFVNYPADATAIANSDRRMANRISVSGSGPWGSLEYLPIVIKPPLENVSDNIEQFSTGTVWRFPSVGMVELTQLLEDISLSAPLRTKLMSMVKIDISSRGTKIYPSREFVLGLSSKDRLNLYAALCDYMPNEDQQKQFVFRGSSPDKWFAGSIVSQEIRELVEPLIYQRRGFMYFADLRSIARTVTPRSERQNLVQTLGRDATFIVHLKLSKNSNVEEIVRYWGRGGREGEIRPIIESLMQNPAEREINIVHLLPPFARRRLYTYPEPSDPETRPRRDCNWTSANFFNETPDDKFREPAQVARRLLNDYRQIRTNLQLGDIAVILDEHNMSVHSAVYIADDVFFHRCGPGDSAAWTLARGEDLANYYPRSKKVSTRYFRRKDL